MPMLSCLQLCCGFLVTFKNRRGSWLTHWRSYIATTLDLRQKQLEDDKDHSLPAVFGPMSTADANVTVLLSNNFQTEFN
jgi:hypothetical protein